jgi:uncharacterized protein (UPF0261 family)
MARSILIIGTMDTKEKEICFLRERIQRRGHRVLLLDAGILADPHEVVPDITRHRVAAAAGASKGKAVATMMRGARKLCRKLYQAGRFDGAVAVGGAQGTAIACAAMQALPRGVPKLVVSTVASGSARFGPYVGTRDIALLHSVADLQGLNSLTARILANAAGAICGMVESLEQNGVEEVAAGGPSVALSMLGTTTPGALRAMNILEQRGFEVVAFHQNGTGGAAMEEMVDEGCFRGVLDLNLHEIADREFHGLHGSVTPGRLEAAGRKSLPQLVAPGSINYYVLGPVDTLPPDLRQRQHMVHNPQLTLVRATPAELRTLGTLVAAKLNAATGPVQVMLPMQGFCFPDRRGEPLYDPEGNRAFVHALRRSLRPEIPVLEIDAHINDAAFIDPTVEAFLALVGGKAQSG